MYSLILAGGTVVETFTGWALEYREYREKREVDRAMRAQAARHSTSLGGAAHPQREVHRPALSASDRLGARRPGQAPAADEHRPSGH